MPTKAEILEELKKRTDLTDRQKAILAELEKRQAAGQFEEKPRPAVEEEAPPPRTISRSPAEGERFPTYVTPEGYEVPTGLKGLGKFALGMGENLLSMGTGAASMAVGGLAGLASAPFVGMDRAGEIVEGIQEGGTYQPRTESGRESAKGLAEAMAPPEMAMEQLRERAYEPVTKAVGEVAGPTAAGVVGSVLETAPVALSMPGGVGRVARAPFKGITKRFGAEPMTLGARAKAGMEEAGIRPSELGPKAQARVERMSQYASPEEAARAEFLREQGFMGEAAPTRAQVSRKASDFVTQQELAKQSGPVLTRLENQSQVLEGKFNKMKSKTGGNVPKSEALPMPSGEKGSVVNVVNKSALELDQAISDLYKEAAKASGGAQVVKAENFMQALKKHMPDNQLSGGLVKSIRGLAKDQGLIGEKGQLMNISVDQAEQLVKGINKRFSPGNKIGNWIGRDLKDAIDLDVAASGGTDMFQMARKAKAAFHKAIGRTAETKFSKRKTSLIDDILTENVNTENILEDAILKKKYRSSEIKDLRNYLTESGEEGLQAWQDLRAEAIDYLKDNSFKGPADEMGRRTISRHRFEQALKKFGTVDKLKEIFSPEEMKFIKDMRKTLEMMEPTPGTFKGEGPSARAINKLWGNLSRRMAKSSIFNTFSEMAFDPQGKALRGKPTVTTPYKRQAAQAAAIGTAAEGMQENE